MGGFDLELFAALMAELAAAAFYVAMGCSAHTIIAHSSTAIIIGLSFGGAVIINYQCFQYASGGHGSPMTTIAAMILEKTDWKRGLLYILMQLLGSFLGYCVVWLLRPNPFNNNLEFFCCTSLGDNVKLYQGVLLEFMATFGFTLAWCSLWDARNEKYNDSMSLRIGFACVAIITATFAFSGGSINPFRSLVPAVCNNYYDDLWIYFAGPIVGSCLAAVLWRFVFSADKAEPKE